MKEFGINFAYLVFAFTLALLAPYTVFAQNVVTDEMKQLEKECNMKNYKSCDELAQRWAFPKNPPKVNPNWKEEHEKSIKYRSQACSGKYYRACLDLIKWNGNKTLGFQVLEQDCKKQKDLEACYFLAKSNYGISQKDGMAQFEELCQRNHADSCYELGYYFANTDKEKSKKAFQKSCKLKQEPSCDLGK